MAKIEEFPNFLSAKECTHVLELIGNSSDGYNISVNPKLVSEILKIVEPKLHGYNFTEFISLGKASDVIKKHVDPKMDKRVTHKLLIYLNTISSGGGTFFENVGYVSPGLGKAVLFDINTPHWGEGFPKGEIKRVIGLRVYKKGV